jgi:predicted nucleotidyltransferase
MDVTVIEQKLADFFKLREEVLFAYLFGSRAKGTSTPASDIDVAVYVGSFPESAGFGYQAELMDELMQTLGRGDVDLVLLNTAKPLLRYHVVRHGRVIFCCSHRERTAFHEKAVRDYQDIRPMLAVQGHYLRQRISDGRFGR